MKADELNTSEVAARLGVSPITARVWCRRGLFPNAYEREESRGSVWVIPAKDLEGFTPPKKTGRPARPKANGGAKPARKRAAKKGAKR
jgi:hypothetical protein